MFRCCLVPNKGLKELLGEEGALEKQNQEGLQVLRLII